MLENTIDPVPLEQRPTLLFLTDDIRFPSGIGTQSQLIVKHTAHRYNWIIVGGGVNHPENGKAIDMSEHYKKELGIDVSVILLPTSGYGTPDLVRGILRNWPNISGILHFTDPRQWIWLYEMEAELRQRIPIMYYAIWDCIPAPKYNQTYYASCDAIFGISKQSVAIHKYVLDQFFEERLKRPEENTVIQKYIPHGVDANIFHPVKSSAEFNAFKENMFKQFPKRPEFVVFWNNRNAIRKKPMDLIVGYANFVRQLRKDGKNDNTLLIMHTEVVSDHGTDLPKVVEDLCPDVQITFSGNKGLQQKEMNYLYNLADVTVNIGNNEGFGLSALESIMAGTLIINNVTGGLQDTCGFKYTGTNEYVTVDEYLKDPNWMTNSDGRFKEHGEWVFPIYPAARTFIGSPLTPYIYNEEPSIPDLTKRLREVYDLSPAERERRGMLGREFALNSGMMSAYTMAENFIISIDEVLANWTPKQPLNIYKV